jgi:hypothetical protein
MIDILLSGVTAITLITALFFLFNYSKFGPAPKAFGYYLVLRAIFEVLASMLMEGGSNNLPYLHLYTLFEFLFLMYFFSRVFVPGRSWALAAGIGGLIIILNSLFVQDINEFNSYSKSLVCLTFILMSIYTLFKIFGRYNRDVMDAYAVKLFCYGLLINLAGSFTLYLFSNLIVLLSLETQQALWVVNVILNIITMVIFITGFIKAIEPNYSYE